MKKKMLTILCAAMLGCALLAGCGSGGSAPAGSETETQEEAGTAEETETAAEAETAEEAENPAPLEDGVYTADFDTDSGMFHVSEACDGKGTLTVEDGKMTIHISLASKNIVNLYPGLAEDAQKEGAVLLEPTTDSVTYSDGITEEVYGFDVPVPALDEEFDLALVGTKAPGSVHRVPVPTREPAGEGQAAKKGRRPEEGPAADLRSAAASGFCKASA